MSTDAPLFDIPFPPNVPTSTPPPPPFIVSPPFDHPKADVILRSSDEIDFRVFKLFLSLASPFFETMFELPQPTPESSGDEVKDGLAVISMTEDSSTLDAFLRFCYPSTLAEDPNLAELKDVVNILNAARKYSLDLIERKVGHALGSPSVLEKEPFRAFAIARHCKMENETEIAAKYTLRHPLIPPIVEELELITAKDLRQLLDYHMRCGVAVQGLNSLQWIEGHYGYTGYRWLIEQQYNNSRCSCARSNKYKLQNGTPPEWWAQYIDATFDALRDRPSGATVLNGLDEAVRNARAKCSCCGQRISENLAEFTRVFSEEVEKVTGMIQLDMDDVLRPKVALNKRGGKKKRT